MYLFSWYLEVGYWKLESKYGIGNTPSLDLDLDFFGLTISSFCRF